jgi:hypothetical protein
VCGTTEDDEDERSGVQKIKLYDPHEEKYVYIGRPMVVGTEKEDQPVFFMDADEDAWALFSR